MYFWETVLESSTGEASFDARLTQAFFQEDRSFENLLNYLTTMGDEIVPGVLFAKVDGEWYASINRFNGPDPYEDRYVWMNTKGSSQQDCVSKLIDAIIGGYHGK